MITPLLKNTIDWCTRADDNPFEGKVAAVISASPGPLGAVRSLVMAQALLVKLGCIVVPGQMLPAARLQGVRRRGQAARGAKRSSPFRH
jgi:chromate reductase